VKKLHLVGLTTDRKNLMLSTRRGSKSGAYTVEIDDDLVQALTQPASGSETPVPTAKRGRSTPNAQQAAELEEILGEQEARLRQDSSLSVRDIQTRLRRGHRLDEVAKEAGVSREWVARFAAPVVAEQAAVVNELREATFSARRKGPSAAPVAESIARNLLDKGVTDVAEQLEQGWRAHQVEGDEWLVRFDYRSRGRTQVAEWRWRRRSGRAVAVNRLAAELAHLEHDAGDVAAIVSPPTLHTRTGSRSRHPSGGEGDRAPSNGARAKRASKRTGGTTRAGEGGTEVAPSRPAAKKAAAKRRPATRAAAKGTTAKRAAATKSTGSKKATAKKAAAAKSTGSKKATAKKATAKKPAAKRAGTVRSAATAGAGARKATPANKRAAARKGTPAKAAPPSKRAASKRAAGKAAAAKPSATRGAARKRAGAPGNNARTKATGTGSSSARPSRGGTPSRPAREPAAPVVETSVAASQAALAEPVSSNGQGAVVQPEGRTSVASPAGGGRMLPTEDPFAGLDLSAGFSPNWRETPVGEPDPDPSPSPRLARTEWPPRVEGGAAPGDETDGGNPSPAPVHRRRAPLRAER
jgi:hypothetical protein